MIATSELEELRSKLRGYKPTEEVRVSFMNDEDAKNKLIIFILNRILEYSDQPGGFLGARELH